MKQYQVTYVREQRIYFDIEAENEDKAIEIAWQQVENTDLSSPDDESDDSGEMWIDEVKEVEDEKKDD